MEEEEKILDNITKNISSRLKVPIILTYICVLIIYNWDILFYLIFENDAASNKVDCIQTKYGDDYFCRILICLSLSVALIVIFTIINTFLNFCLKWFYKKDKEFTTEVENYEKINILSEQLSQSLTEIKNLNAQVENLKNINQSLNKRDLEINVSEISQKDFDDFVNFLRTQPNSEKLRYSFKELILAMKKDSSLELDDLYEDATYEQEMETVINHLLDRNLLSLSGQFYNKNKERHVSMFDMSKSFQDFLKMDL